MGVCADAGVGSVMIVVMQPIRVGRGAVCLGLVGVRVGPFGGQGAVEAFDFPVGLWSVGAGPDVADPGPSVFSEKLYR